MTQEEILEYNKLCAEFLGKDKKGSDVTWTFPSYLKGQLWVDEHFFNNEEQYSGRRLTDVSELKFHSDWNWIHEVAESIKNTTNPKEHSDTTFSTLRREIQTHLGRSYKEAVVQAINQFLIWHEQNKTQ